MRSDCNGSNLRQFHRPPSQVRHKCRVPGGGENPEIRAMPHRYGKCSLHGNMCHMFLHRSDQELCPFQKHLIVPPDPALRLAHHSGEDGQIRRPRALKLLHLYTSLMPPERDLQARLRGVRPFAIPRQIRSLRYVMEQNLVGGSSNHISIRDIYEEL